MQDNVQLEIIANRYHYKALFPLSPREFVALSTWTPIYSGRSVDEGHGMETADVSREGILVVTVSLPDQFYPLDNVFVRAHVLMSCFFMRTLSENVTEVTMVNHSHLGANVPAYIVNRAAVNIPVQYVKKLKTELEHDSH
jgi:hypothetical protein